MEDDVLFIPQGVMRNWPEVESTVPLLPGLKIAPASTAAIFTPAVGFIPVYKSLEDLIAEHGDVPFLTFRVRP